MTRTFNEKIRCPHCGWAHTVETDFERWVRNHPDLDSSSAGVVRFDLDMLLHKYKFLVDGKNDRTFQCLMFVEVKTMMAEPSESQRDTLGVLNQILRNRKVNMHKKPRQQSAGPAKVKSRILGKEIRIGLYGGHLLQLDGTCPENSSRLAWDHEEISVDVLIDLLLFRRDPDNPRTTMDHRRRARAWSKAPRLFPC